MAQGTRISFVVWPDGRVDDRSLTLCGERIAREGFINGYLPEEWFGRSSRSYIADTLWRGATEKGFRSYTIEIGADGKPRLADG
jgi:hypothetical protein